MPQNVLRRRLLLAGRPLLSQDGSRVRWTWGARRGKLHAHSSRVPVGRAQQDRWWDREGGWVFGSWGCIWWDFTVSRDVTCWGARVRNKDVRVVRCGGLKRLGWDPRPGGWGVRGSCQPPLLCGTIFCTVFKGLETTKQNQQVGSCMIW